MPNNKNINVPVLAIASQKGGVGKTTTTEAIARGVAADGGRVLVLDFDPQGLASSLLADCIIDGSPDVIAFAKGRRLKLDGPVDKGTIVCVPGYDDLTFMSDDEASMNDLSDAIDAAVAEGSFDLVVIDTHPGKEYCVILALEASTHIVMPAVPDSFSIDGVRRTLELLFEIGEEIGEDWAGRLGVAITMCRPMTRLHRTVEAQMRQTLPDEYGVHVFTQHITVSIQIPEAQAMNKSPYEIDRVLHGATRDYRFLTDEVMGWLKHTSGLDRD